MESVYRNLVAMQSLLLMNSVRSFWRSLITLWYLSDLLYRSTKNRPWLPYLRCNLNSQCSCIFLLKFLITNKTLFPLLQEARNIEDFLENFKDDPTVKIPQVYKQLSGSRVLVMEWIDGIRCTNPQVQLSV